MDADQTSGKDRRKTLIQVAYNHIATRGFEGLRVRDVAAEVGINNATLHYYFPTKEDLIQGVVDDMIAKFILSYPSAAGSQELPDAWKEMHAELEDARYRFLNARDQLIVFTELFIRSLRDPGIARIFKKFDESWHGYLESVIKRGKDQGVFRADLDPGITATLLMLQIKGFGYQMLDEANPAFADKVFDQLVQQVETWLKAG
jgi:AcrR family transcriptional regulator